MTVLVSRLCQLMSEYCICLNVTNPFCLQFRWCTAVAELEFILRDRETHEQGYTSGFTVKTLNIGTPRPATVVVLNIKPFNFTMK